MSLVRRILLISLLLLLANQLRAQSPERWPLWSKQELMAALSDSPAGRTLLGRALKRWNTDDLKDIAKQIHWGPVSKTDSLITRTLDPLTGKERRERHVTLFLKRSQAFSDLVLDFAHELSHAVSPGNWDPYDPQLTAGKYILRAIEGPGGEVAAVQAECQVAKELGFSSIIKWRCGRYLNSRTGEVETGQMRQDFYRVGIWIEKLRQKLGNEVKLFPLLAASSPRLYSSTGNAPYPMALYQEFLQLNQAACQNSYRRLASLEQWQGRESGNREKVA